jgi:hypothetical protein
MDRLLNVFYFVGAKFPHGKLICLSTKANKWSDLGEALREAGDQGTRGNNCTT